METITDHESVLAERLRVAVTRTARRLRQEAHSELTPTLTAALATVLRDGPLTPSDLARREGVQRPTATKLIAALEDRELVLRTSVPGDGRSSLIAITPEGESLLATVRARKDEFLATRLRDLPARDRATLERASVLLGEMVRA